MIGGGPKKNVRDIAKIQSILSELTDRETEEVLKELKKVQEKEKKEKKILRQEATTATYHENWKCYQAGITFFEVSTFNKVIYHKFSKSFNYEKDRFRQCSKDERSTSYLICN